MKGLSVMWYGSLVLTIVNAALKIMQAEDPRPAPEGGLRGGG